MVDTDNIDEETTDELRKQQKEYEPTLEKQLQGCPKDWPQVERWSENLFENFLDQREIGNFRHEDAMVVEAALSTYHREFSIIQSGFCFPEAGQGNARLSPHRP